MGVRGSEVDCEGELRTARGLVELRNDNVSQAVDRGINYVEVALQNIGFYATGILVSITTDDMMLNLAGAISVCEFKFTAGGLAEHRNAIAGKDPLSEPHKRHYAEAELLFGNAAGILRELNGLVRHIHSSVTDITAPLDWYAKLNIYTAALQRLYLEHILPILHRALKIIYSKILEEGLGERKKESIIALSWIPVPVVEIIRIEGIREEDHIPRQEVIDGEVRILQTDVRELAACEVGIVMDWSLIGLFPMPLNIVQMLVGVTRLDREDKRLKSGPVRGKDLEVAVNHAGLIALAHRISENIDAVVAAVSKDFVVINGLFSKSIDLGLVLFTKESV